jgi:hypothetical protein
LKNTEKKAYDIDARSSLLSASVRRFASHAAMHRPPPGINEFVFLQFARNKTKPWLNTQNIPLGTGVYECSVDSTLTYGSS